MRWITLDGAVNVRDVGGIPTGDGLVTAEKRLLRADNLQGLSDADVARLVEEFSLTLVVDLRSYAEVTSEAPGPLATVASVEHVHHSVIPAERDRDLTSGVVSQALLARGERFAGAHPDDVVAAHYLGYLEDRPDSVIGALRAIASTPGTALVHCAAGKDRTGVIIALALLAVGADRDAVVADYAASAERIDAVLSRLRASSTYAAAIDRVSADMHTPRASGMNRFLDLLDSRSGGVSGWLADQGFDAGDVELLRRKLLSG
jgi:protein tyrosine/serine phosphatase